MFETLIMVVSIAANIVLAAALFQAKRDYDSLQDDCLSLETDNEDLRGRNEDATREIRRLKDLVDAYHETNQSLAAKVGDLEVDNAQVVKISNDQFAKVQNQQAIIDELTSENDRLKSGNIGLEISHEVAWKEIHELREKLAAKENPLGIRWIGDTGIPEIPDDLPPSVTVTPLPDEARKAMTVRATHGMAYWWDKVRGK